MSTIAATEFLPLVATEAAATSSLIVSLHDVAPCSQQIASTIISELSAHGVRVCSILVVPDYHHEGALAKHSEFVTWLRALESDGHEIVIHGFFHERPPHRKETLRDKFITRFYTRNEGEFYDLGYEEALRRITTARDQFRALGLKPRGFIAPAWLMGSEAEQAVRDAELEYTTRLRTVCDLRSQSVFPARTLVYSVHNSWRRALSRSWNAGLFRLMKSKPLLRISIHPPDYSHPVIWKQILGFVSATKTARTATTYQDWIAEQRLTRGM
jgi:predicted deacetylase